MTNAGSQFSGGDATFTFGIAPLGEPTKPTGRFDASYAEVDLAELTDFYQFAGVRFAGRATGRNLLEWPMGRFSEHRGDGQFAGLASGRASPMVASLEAARAADPNHSRHEWGPFLPMPLAICTFRLPRRPPTRIGADAIEVRSGQFATEKTHVSFDGRPHGATIRRSGST